MKTDQEKWPWSADGYQQGSVFGPVLSHENDMLLGIGPVGMGLKSAVCGRTNTAGNTSAMICSKCSQKWPRTDQQASRVSQV